MFEKEEKFIKEIVVKAYKKVIKKHSVNVSVKGEKDLVTNLDLATEKFIIENIKNQFPNDYIVSEEFNSLNKLKGRCWIIDPIDGTINFAKGINDWCVQMAFVCDGKTRTSAIYVPTLKKLYFASSKGAFCNNKPISVNKNSTPDVSVVAHGHVDKKYSKIEDIISDSLKEMRKYIMSYRHLGSAGLEHAYLANGLIEGEMFFADNMWDWVPGTFLCEMAGGFASSKMVLDKKIHAVFATEELKNIYEKTLTKYENKYLKQNKK